MTKLFHFHRIFKNEEGGGVQVNPLWICHCTLNMFIVVFSYMYVVSSKQSF